MHFEAVTIYNLQQAEVLFQGDPCTQELSKLWEAYKPAREDDLQGCSSLARALWSTLSKHSRNDLLTVKVYDIMQHAWQVSQDDSQGRDTYLKHHAGTSKDAKIQESTMSHVE